MKIRLLPLTALGCLLAYPRMPLTLTPPSLGALTATFPPELATYFSEPGSQAADALVRLGFLVFAPEDIVPLALWGLAAMALFAHVWLWLASTLAILGRPQPFGGRHSLALLVTALISVAFLVLYEPIRTHHASLWPLLPLTGIALLGTHFWRETRRGAAFPAMGKKDGPAPWQWSRWATRVTLDGVLAAAFIHVVHYGVEHLLPRDLIDPPFARLVGLATPFPSERWLLVSLVPGLVLLSAWHRAPSAPWRTARVVATLLLALVLVGGVGGDWTFGRVFVASWVEPALFVTALAATLFWLGRQRRPEQTPLTTT